MNKKILGLFCGLIDEMMRSNLVIAMRQMSRMREAGGRKIVAPQKSKFLEVEGAKRSSLPDASIIRRE